MFSSGVPATNSALPRSARLLSVSMAEFGDFSARFAGSSAGVLAPIWEHVLDNCAWSEAGFLWIPLYPVVAASSQGR
jgi:hypothetical protein